MGSLCVHHGAGVQIERHMYGQRRN